MNNVVWLSASAVALLAIVALSLLNSSYLSDVRLLLPSSSSEVADLVVTNALIYTSDPSLPFADSMAIRRGRILRVGNHSSIQIAQVELRGVNRKDEFVRRIKEAVKNKKHGSWMLGGGWNNDFWGGELPEASWIDDLTPHNPVWLSRMDGHMGLANSLTLRIAGITSSTEDPDGGMIVRNTYGEPTGLLIDSAMTLLLPWIPEVSVDERREALARASNLALKSGVTTVVDLGRYFPGTSTELSWDDFSDVYQWADSSGKMTIRVCLFFPMETWSRLLDLILRTGRVLSQWIYLGGVKAFADGSVGSNSALFYEPYIDEPNNYGLQLMEFDSLFNMTLAADKSELQVAIHAIGDKANDLILDLYESIFSMNGMRDRRFRIEHAQHLTPGTPARFGELGIFASVQPEHLLDDADSMDKKLGADRAQNESYLFHSLLANNVQLAFGSDWPVANINPLGGIRTAMKRIPPGWENAWIPSECISLKDALNAYTIYAARACFLDHDLGSLSPGKLADFVILSTKSWDDFAAEGSASIEATYVGGKQAHP
ncbi:protein LONG AFTER FAR-RED 3 isoform X2 [Malania oleifera]|uniref:protein LONG AFTER FAR-RED 3 isoform X2 n=1 Tax=Malania oleifera TaxID=397392 RepID=UPI0025AEC44A|nr:protein LONG AFTER FAR-RED 3 isoform X2 [Malania oleifera]XP_057976449.1 protein LONG AFTER FAR-RED 3 isoform X2 [Malania oleifera]